MPQNGFPWCRAHRRRRFRAVRWKNAMLKVRKGLSTLPRERSKGIVLGSHHNFHLVQSPWCPANEDVLTFLAAGTHLDFQIWRYIYKSNGDGLRISHLHITWETLMIMIAQTPENPADVSVLFSKNTGCFLPVTFTNRVQAATTSGGY